MSIGGNEFDVLFAAIPWRAIKDERIKLAHILVLATIAVFDRLSITNRGRKGCFASHKTLAEFSDLHKVTISKCIRDLIEWGYLIAEINDKDKRKRVYRVRYEEVSALTKYFPSEDSKVNRPANEKGKVVSLRNHQAIGNTGKFSPIRKNNIRKKQKKIEPHVFIVRRLMKLGLEPEEVWEPLCEMEQRDLAKFCKKAGKMNNKTLLLTFANLQRPNPPKIGKG